MPRRWGCCESLGVHDLALVSPSSSLFFTQEILYKPIREWILLINLEGLVPTNASTGLYCCFRLPGAVLIDYVVKLLAITLIDMHTFLHLEFYSKQITRCCSFWHIMFFCNQIMALPLRMTPCMCVSRSWHKVYCCRNIVPNLLYFNKLWKKVAFFKEVCTA